jgi:hypothetical protein
MQVCPKREVEEDLSYFEDEPGRRSAAKLLSKDEARRTRRISPKLPELVSPVAHSEDGKHRGQGGDNRKCDD